MNDDPRYKSEKNELEMRKTLSDLGKNTNKFIKEHTTLSRKAEELKYRNFVDERKKYQSDQFGHRHHSSNVGQELRQTLSKLQKITHSFVREHDELANRAEYLKYKDFVTRREKHD